MEEEQIPEAWKEEQVVFKLDSDQHGDQHRNYGTLQEVSALGLTIRKNVTLYYGQVNDYGQPEMQDRIVPLFYPWHRIQYVRLAEVEEQ